MTSQPRTAALPSLWRHADFRRLWGGQAISEIGSRITREGVPMAAVMLLGATPWQMGVLAALGAVAVLFFSPLAGLWVDRLRRRPILIVADVGRALVLASIPLAAWHGSLSMAQLYVVIGLAGILTVFFDVAYQTYLPSLVPAEQVLEGNSKLALTASIAEILGPSVTGILIQTITAPIAILLDAISFVVSAGSVALIRQPETKPQPHEQHLREELTAGFRAIRQEPVLFLLAGRAVTMGIFSGFFGTLYILYAQRELGLNPALLGVVIAVGGFSNLMGALTAERISRRLGVGRTFLGSAIAINIGLWFLPLAHGPVWMAALFVAGQQLCTDWAYVVYTVNETALRQTITPPHVLGRVNAATQLLARGVYPIGTLLAGLIAEQHGVRTALYIAVIGNFASIGWLLPGVLRNRAAAATIPA